MSLKKSIVVVNQFSQRIGPNKGTRGATPGMYALRYMARDKASEPVTPIRYDDVDTYVTRYMLRQEALDTALSLGADELVPKMKSHSSTDSDDSSLSLEDEVEQLTKDFTFDVDPDIAIRHHQRRDDSLVDEFKDLQGRGGLAFGYGSHSLSHIGVVHASKDIQRLFDDNHTVLKTVLSYNHEYLQRHGLVSPDFTVNEAGDYRGNFDQLKLRLALMHGLDRLGTQYYDDLRYIGVIQVDTKHVHCHLVMADAGHGTLATNGRQRGKLLAPMKSVLRRSIDNYLDRSRHVATLSSAVSFDKVNVKSYMTQWAMDTVADSTQLRAIVHALPDDKSLWRASSNAKSMKKAHKLTESFVMDRLMVESSPYHQARLDIKDYADYRKKNEGLSNKEHKKLISRGEKFVRDTAMNAVYGVLKNATTDKKKQVTPLVAAALHDDKVLARKSRGGSRISRFALKYKRYSQRLSHHREKRSEYKKLLDEFYDMDAAGQVHEDAYAVQRFYQMEYMYHDMCVSKYESYIPGSKIDIKKLATQGWNKVKEAASKWSRLVSMSQDSYFSQCEKSKDGADYGQRMYDLPGGNLLSAGYSNPEKGRAVIAQRIDKSKDDYDDALLEYEAECLQAGAYIQRVDKKDYSYDDNQHKELVELKLPRPRLHRSDVDADEETTYVLVIPESYELRDVKSVDLHHAALDIFEDVAVDETVFQDYSSLVALRSYAYDKATEYFVRSGQEDMAQKYLASSGSDIESMRLLKKNMESQVAGQRVLRAQMLESVDDSSDSGEVESIDYDPRIIRDVTHELSVSVRDSNPVEHEDQWPSA